MNVTLLL
ncbi:hypothetical protein CCHL11_06569 [Colletotrichum chlorophyti]|nr:hypothetical protein CCHL11_06569 [Colletotrichum chlorophyti]